MNLLSSIVSYALNMEDLISNIWCKFSKNKFTVYGSMHFYKLVDFWGTLFIYQLFIL